MEIASMLGQKARIIPLGTPCLRALNDYLQFSRNFLVADKTQKKLFVNCSGLNLTRQGFWKIVKYYKEHTKNDKKYQTKEMIWAYISIVLGYDYMFDDSTDERWKNGYLSDDWDEVDPVEEFVYRAVYDTKYN